MTHPDNCPSWCLADTDSTVHVGEYDGTTDPTTGAGAMARPVQMDDGTTAIDIAVINADGTQAQIRLAIADASEFEAGLAGALEDCDQ